MMKDKKARIILCANTAWYIYNFRANLILKLMREGHDVISCSPYDKYARELPGKWINIPIEGKGMNPFTELLLLWKYRCIFRDKQPDVILTYTTKPNLLVNIAASFCKIPTITNISGLGYLFTGNPVKKLIGIYLYKFSLRKSKTVFFQNSEDAQLFLRNNIVSSDKFKILPGSGVDLEKFTPSICNSNKDNQTVIFLLIGRMLWDKGVGEYIEAAKTILNSFPNSEFRLLGPAGVDNPSAIEVKQIELWEKEGIVKYLGSTSDVRPYIQEADCVVLPSYYREGTPRSLLEASAMGKAIITTDAVGCRDVVDDGDSGFLVRAKDSVDLANKMETFLCMNQEERQLMGIKGRKKMESQYDEKIVIKAYLDEIDRLL